MASKTDVANMAVAHLGHGKQFTDVLTDDSQAAILCRIFLAPSLEQMLTSFPWPFAKKTEALALVEEDPTTEWAYSYRYPTTCARFGRILSGDRNEARSTRIPYKIAYGNTGRLIYTDVESAVAEFTLNITDYSLLPMDFVIAHSYLLASMVASPLTGGDHFKLGEKALQRYLNIELPKAQANSLNQEQAEEEPTNELIASRG